MAGINAAVQDSPRRHPRREVLSAARTPSARSSARANESISRHEEPILRSSAGAFHGLNSLFTGLLYTIVVVGGGYFVAAGTPAVTDLAIYALYVGHLHGTGRAAHQLHRDSAEGFTRASAASSRCRAERPDVATKPGAPTLAEGPAAARCAALWIIATRRSLLRRHSIRCSTGSRFPSSPAPRWRSWGPRAAAARPPPARRRASTTWPAAR